MLSMPKETTGPGSMRTSASNRSNGVKGVPNAIFSKKSIETSGAANRSPTRRPMPKPVFMATERARERPNGRDLEVNRGQGFFLHKVRHRHPRGACESILSNYLEVRAVPSRGAEVLGSRNPQCTD